MSLKLWVFRFFVLVAEIIITYSVFNALSTDVGLQADFTWHPILMTVGFAGFMNEGLLQYYLGDLDQKKRSESRIGHGMFQILCCACVLGGYIAIFRAHEKGQKSQFWSPGTPFIKVVHVCIGYVAVLMVLLQFVIGLIKLWAKLRRDESMYKWHGYSGITVYFLGMFNILLGCIFWDSKTWVDGWSKTFAILCVFLLFCSLFYVQWLRNGAQNAHSASMMKLTASNEGSDNFYAGAGGGKYTDNDDGFKEAF